ncbi:hypothetical protein [Halovenus marina]|uniref:hypothetical protein n=1 Tax=Halovenus marina TaxID=3396621 RepID=UPI003F5426E2
MADTDTIRGFGERTDIGFVHDRWANEEDATHACPRPAPRFRPREVELDHVPGVRKLVREVSGSRTPILTAASRSDREATTCRPTVPVAPVTSIGSVMRQ